MRALAALLLLMSLTACGNSYDRQVEKLDSHLTKNRIGNSADVYLVKHGIYGPERVAVIFGMADDYLTCTEIARDIEARYPGSAFSCSTAN